MMEQLNTHIFNVFNMIRQFQQSGFLVRPLKYRIYHKDKKVLNNIYIVYKLYCYGLSKKDFHKICIDYTTNTGTNIIKSGSDMAELLEKINSK